MKLPVAVGLGAIASVAIPYALKSASGAFGAMMHNISRMVQIGGIEFRFSFTIFLIVTLFSWAFFIWSDR